MVWKRNSGNKTGGFNIWKIQLRIVLHDFSKVEVVYVT